MKIKPCDKVCAFIPRIGLSSLLLAVVAASISLRCGGRNPESRLKSLFPARASQVLAGNGFSQTPRGFVPRAPSGRGAVKAAEASLSSRGGLRLNLPPDGSGSATFSLPGGFAIEVRERGLAGRAHALKSAVAYPREGGASYWTAGSRGYEEWVLVENTGAGPVAEWEVRGASLRQAGEGVEIADGAGVRLRVTAPVAFDRQGGIARAWLSVHGQVIALHTDARGPALVDPLWLTTRPLATARDRHTATLLASGKVLVAGGFNSSTASALASAELYDEATETWTTTGSLATARFSHTATLLPSGKVLVAGGTGATGALASAELYNEATGTWTPTGSLATARSSHPAALLPSGKVLVAGGTGAGAAGALAGAELYNEATGAWAATGSLAAARSLHPATRLPSGKVLVAGGQDETGALASAELFDEATGTWTPTGSLATARFSHPATQLPSGNVLVVGGRNATGFLAGAEVFDEAEGTWTTTNSLATARALHTAMLANSNAILVAGGQNEKGFLASAERYDEPTGTWAATDTLARARALHTATLVPSGRVLVGGGADATGSLAGAELYDESFWTPTGSLAPNFDHTATLLPSGKVLAAGSSTPPGGLDHPTAQLYDEATGAWTTTGSPATGSSQTATLLPSGRVLVACCGFDGTKAVPSAELYNEATGTWTPTGSLATVRGRHTATLLPSGKVLVVGGHDLGTGGVLASAELYDEATGAWTTTGSLATAREFHTATLLPSGKVLVAGGLDFGTATAFASAELYDEATGTWTPTGSLATARFSHTATLLPSGKVLVAGGSNACRPAPPGCPPPPQPQGFSTLASAELYDEATGIWTPTGSLTNDRKNHTATLVPSGEVLVAGGVKTSGGRLEGALETAELYDEATGTWTGTISFFRPRASPRATLLRSGRVLATGGDGRPNVTTAELWE